MIGCILVMICVQKPILILNSKFILYYKCKQVVDNNPFLQARPPRTFSKRQVFPIFITKSPIWKPLPDENILFIFPYIVGPFYKLIASDSLTYLPNLYYRKFSLIENLNELRQDFPEQKILLVKPMTKWDCLLT